MNKLLLIDGNNLFHRAYHAIPHLTNKEGEATNAVFGFSNMLIKAISEVSPRFIACAFDTQAPTFRHIEFEKYKAQRVAPPPDLYPQLPKVKKILDAYGIKYFDKEGYEADDIIATLASRLVNSSQSTVHSQKQKTVNREQKAKRTVNWSIHNAPWPKYDPKLATSSKIELVVQVNGKVRDRITVDRGIGKEDAQKLALELKNTQKYLSVKVPQKVIFVKGRLINFVVEV